MPWTELDWKWNIWGPHEKEWDMHMVSYHGYVTTDIFIGLGSGFFTDNAFQFRHLWDYGGRRALAWAKIRREMEEVSLSVQHVLLLVVYLANHPSSPVPCCP